MHFVNILLQLKTFSDESICVNNDVCFSFQLILVSVLNCLYDAVSQMLKKNVEKRALIDNLDGAFLILDEICDNG